jgi:hypothetical protein
MSGVQVNCALKGEGVTRGRLCCKFEGLCRRFMEWIRPL